MPSLPFAVQPRQHPPRRVGTLDSGILEIPVLGGLTVAESAAISELLAGDISTFVQGAQAADVIAKAEDISQPEAFSIIERFIAGIKLDAKEEEIRLRHAVKLDALAKVYAASGERNIQASVTAILQNRLQLTDWTLEDTKVMPRVLLQDIWQLIMDEQTAENLPANRPTDDDLKKQPPVSGSSRVRTGKASSGGFAMPTPERSTETPLLAS